MKKFSVLYEPEEVYNNMLKDIAAAKKFIYLETYIYDDDSIGEKFREQLKKFPLKIIQSILLPHLLWEGCTRKRMLKDLFQNQKEYSGKEE